MIALSELDIDIAHKIARGMTYKQIALAEGLREQTVKNRMVSLRRAYQANTIPHLISILIASDVLRVQDQYNEEEVLVMEYKRGGRARQSYWLKNARP